MLDWGLKIVPVIFIIQLISDIRSTLQNRKRNHWKIVKIRPLMEAAHPTPGIEQAGV